MQRALHDLDSVPSRESRYGRSATTAASWRLRSTSPAAGKPFAASPAERADVIVDFTYVRRRTCSATSDRTSHSGRRPDSISTSRIRPPPARALQFRVVAAVAPDPTTPPQYLVLPPVPPLPVETVTRRLALIEEMSRSQEFAADPPPVEAELGTIEWDSGAGVGAWRHFEWRAPVTENPAAGATEIWELYNVTADAHPIHIHEVVFEVVNRQDILVFEVQKQVQINNASPPTPPEPSETGFKDTVIAYPGTSDSRAGAVQFATASSSGIGHIVEHEDNEICGRTA